MRIPIRRKRSRYQKARAALRDLIPRSDKRSRHKRKPPSPATASEHDIPEHERGFAGLHWMTAGLYMASGAEAALGQRRGDYRSDDAVRWAPLVAAPLAGAAQAARAIWPGETTRKVACVMNSLALCVGAAGLASSMRASLTDDGDELDYEPSLSERMPSLAPLAFGAVGLLGLLLDSEEEEAAEAHPAQAPRGRRGHGDVKRIRIRI